MPCPVGSFIIDGVCIDCTSATLPSGATASGCQTCSNTQGFVAADSTCLKCTQSLYSNGSASSGSCLCKNSTMVWSGPIQTCSCYFQSGNVATYSNGQVNCISCFGTSLSTATGCSCGGSTSSYDPTYKICIFCPGIENSNGLSNSRGDCVCYPGYKFTDTYPYRCACSYVYGGYLDGTCKNCSSLPATGSVTANGCSICDATQGFLLISWNQTCLKCSSIPNTNGKASIQGC